MNPEPLTGADLQRLAERDPEAWEVVWSKAVIVAIAKGYDPEDLLDMALGDLFDEDKEDE